MARKRKGRAIDGVLLLDKPAGITSNHALQRVKRLLQAAKAGHTGSLDPLATGVLPLCFGEATKFSQFLLDADKRYRSIFALGVTTTTGDADGEVTGGESAGAVTQEQVEAALKQFAGEITQVPSMFSALKHEGQPLYKLARQGIEIERKSRQVTVYAIELLEFTPGENATAEVMVHCSKGTYIRSIAEDLGAALGCGAHVKTLRRTAAGAFNEDRAATLEQLEAACEAGGPEALDAWLLPADAPVMSLPALILPESSAFYFRQGNPVMDSQVYRLGRQGDIVRVFAEQTARDPAISGGFLGLGELTEDGRVAPKRLVASSVS